MPDVTNDNYLICWSAPGGCADDPNQFGLLVGAMQADADIADDGPLYRFTGGNGDRRQEFERIGTGALISTDGCCWAGWPGKISKGEHEKALLGLAIKVMADGVPTPLVIEEFRKIPAFAEMQIEWPGSMFTSNEKTISTARSEITRPTKTAQHLKKEYVDAADSGNWALCRAICNSVGCGLGTAKDRAGSLPRMSLMDRLLWRKMFDLACSPSMGEETWQKLRPKVVGGDGGT